MSGITNANGITATDSTLEAGDIVNGGSGSAYDLELGQTSAQDIFSGIVRPELLNEQATGIKNVLAGVYTQAAVKGGVWIVVQDSTATDTTKAVYGVVVDNAGTPNFKAAIQANYNGTTGASSLQLLSNDGTDQTALLLEADGAGATRATITVDKLTIALPTYANNAAALLGGLTADDIYKTATGEVRVVV